MTQLVRFDWAIKYLLRNKANFDILEGFLSELLKTPIYIETVLESVHITSHLDLYPGWLEFKANGLSTS
jgi:hypothetical protein